MKKKSILAVLSLLIAAGSAWAQTAPGTGVYVGAGVSVAPRDTDTALPAGGYAHSDRFGWFLPGRLYAGYSFSENWSLELGRTDFGRHEIAFTFPSGSGSFRNRMSSYYLAGKYGVALDAKWSVFGKAGYGYNTLRYHNTGIGMSYQLQDKFEQHGAYLAAGVEYAITPKAGIVLEYENVNHMKGDRGRAGAIGISGRYRF